VRYVLEGSVRKAGDRVRITAQLIDALTGHHLWGERYDKDLKDIFALQDEITMKIITELQVKLTDGEQARLRAKGTENLQAYLKYLQAREHWQIQTKEDNALARHLLEEVIALDPEFPQAYTLLGATHWMDIFLKSSKSPKASLERAFELTKKAIALDDSYPEAHSHLGWLYTMAGRHDKGIAECERAVALDPNAAGAHIWMGIALRYAGRHEEAVRHSEQALRLNPIPPSTYFRSLGAAYNFAGRYEEGITAFKKALNRSPNDLLSHVGLAQAYSLEGRMEEAQAEAEQVLKINPKFSLEYFAKRWSYKNQADKDRSIDSLLKAGLPKTPPLPLPDKPSIAVLPFVNMSGDPEQEYFSDGLTEDLITDLSKFRGLFVISRNSVFIYKGQVVKPEQVRKELGVRYMLEGSVRKAGKRVRITAQLIDTTTGGHQWAERYDRELKDIFTLQDEITQQIVSALGVKFEQIEQERALRKDTANLNAFDYNLRGWWYYHRFTREDNEQARRMFEKAIEIEPKFADAYAGLGLTYYEQWARQWSQDPQSLERAFELAKRAIALDDSRSAAYSLLSHVYLWKKQHAQAIAAIKRTINLDPNDARGYADLAETLVWAGKPSEALGLVEKAMRLNPHYPATYLFTLGFAYFTMERYEEAVAALKRALTRSPDHLGALLVLATIYSEIGREEEARAHVAEALRVNPQLSLEVLRQRLPALPERYIESLRKAGLPD